MSSPAPRGNAPPRSSSPLAFPSSSVAGTPRAQRANGNAPATSSPLNFPSSSPGGTGLLSSARGSRQLPRSGLASELDQPMATSQADMATPVGPRQYGVRRETPLFFPASGGSTPRRPRRGDIHSSMPYYSPLAARNGESRLPRGSSPSVGTEGDAPMTDGPERRQTAGPPGSALTFSVAGDTDPAGPEGDDGMTRYIWGTNILLTEAMNEFTQFLRGFKLKYRQQYNADEAKRIVESGEKAPPPMPLYDGISRARGEIALYESYCVQLVQTGQTALNLDSINLLAFPITKNLYHQLMTYPQELVPIMDQTLKDRLVEVADELYEAARDKYVSGIGAGTREEQAEREMEFERAKLDREDVQSREYRVRPFAPERNVNMRDLNPNDTDKIVSIKGLVIRATPVIPDMSSAFFRCLVCQHTVPVEIDRGKIAEPDVCPREVCRSKGTMSLIHNRCTFNDKQVIRLQETPDAVPDGQTPHTVSLCVYDELVDLVKPGDRVMVTGIFRSIPVRVNPRMRSIKSLFKTYLDVVHVKRTNVARLGYDPSTRGNNARAVGVGVGGRDDEEEILGSTYPAAALDAETQNGDEDANPAKSASKEMEEKLLELSRNPDLYDLLSRSMAPSIYEMDDVKKGILLQLFGGTNKSVSNGGGGEGPRYRGDINILMVGDPGTSKSQILHYVHKIAPRGVYTSGKGSSAVGLTAYVTRDPDSKQLVLESGALVLSDGGVCCIDEFDKMSDATRSVLHEVMEQQTVSIAKAGIITTLNARTSILAAANPIESRYNPKLPIPQNIDLPPTLISRFDLLYLVLDKVDEMNDRRLAKHLVGLYLEDRPDTGGHDIIPVETLTAYITYARAKVHPVLTEGASTALVTAYVEMRKAGVDSRTQEKRITATTRQLESMIRLSEAHARMRFSETVDLQDVLEAVRLIKSALRESATDPLTGQIDLDLINTGAGAAARRARGDLKREVMSLVDAAGRQGLRWTAAIRQLDAQATVPVDHAEFNEVIKNLVDEGVVRVLGERERRTIKRLAD